MEEDLFDNLTDAQKAYRVEEAKADIVKADEAIELLSDLRKLSKMKEFINVINNNFFDKYAREIFVEMTSPKQFATIPLMDCEDTLNGIKELKAFIGFEGNRGKVELDAQVGVDRKKEAQRVLDAIG